MQYTVPQELSVSSCAMEMAQSCIRGGLCWVLGKGSWVVGKGSSPEGGGHRTGSAEQWAWPQAAEFKECLNNILRHRV